MKKRKIFFSIILTLTGIWLINKIINYWYFKHDVFINEHPHTGHLDLVLKRISCNSIDFHFSDDAALSVKDENGAILPDTLPNKDSYHGWIYMDTLKQQYYFKETYYKAIENQPDNDYTPGEEMHRWITLDKEGNVVDSAAIDSLMPAATAILLKDEKGNFPDWNNKKSVAYIRYFSREQFNWDIFNPFRGMGNPTGSSPTPYWFGHAYYTINYQGEKIEFKEEAASYGGGEYRTGLTFSVTPGYVKNMPAITFIISDKNFERSGLYIIERK